MLRHFTWSLHRFVLFSCPLCSLSFHFILFLKYEYIVLCLFFLCVKQFGSTVLHLNINKVIEWAVYLMSSWCRDPVSTVITSGNTAADCWSKAVTEWYFTVMFSRNISVCRKSVELVVTPYTALLQHSNPVVLNQVYCSFRLQCNICCLSYADTFMEQATQAFHSPLYLCIYIK